jgi:branched-subunit amino acid transport protein
MTIWVAIIIVGLLTYVTRLSSIVLLGHRKIPASLSRALRFVPPAVLTALIFPALLLSSGNQTITLFNERLIAGLIAAIIAWRTKNVMLTIVVGMVVLLLLREYI